VSSRREHVRLIAELALFVLEGGVVPTLPEVLLESPMPNHSQGSAFLVKCGADEASEECPVIACHFEGGSARWVGSFAARRFASVSAGYERG